LSNSTTTTDIYTLSLHDALPISLDETPRVVQNLPMHARNHQALANKRKISAVIFDYGEVLCRPPSLEHLARMAEVFHMRGEQFRSEEHTSELQSRGHLVCRLLLE